MMTFSVLLLTIVKVAQIVYKHWWQYWYQMWLCDLYIQNQYVEHVCDVSMLSMYVMEEHRLY